jgi:hypothetical protein
MTASSAKKTKSGAATLPVIPPAVKDSDATQQIMHTLRHFHLGNPSVREKVQRVGSDFLPALLEPYRDVSRLRYDYPLFLFNAEQSVANPEPEQLAKPIAEVLSESVASFAPGGESARILKDNLPWVERELRQKLVDVEGPVAATEMVQAACNALLEHLKLDKENNAKLQEEIAKMLQALPAATFSPTAATRRSIYWCTAFAAALSRVMLPSVASSRPISAS